MSELKHMVYVSFSDKDLAESDLVSLLVEIRKKNKKQNVTGMLLYNEGSFIQVIEGFTQKINDLFEKIKGDTRHNTIVVLLDEVITSRSFPNWTMGYQKLTNQQASTIHGFSDFMESEDQKIVLKNSTPEVIYLLNSFKEYT